MIVFTDYAMWFPKILLVQVLQRNQKKLCFQESKQFWNESLVTNAISKRNASIIVGLQLVLLIHLSVVTTEIAHKLSVGDRVRIKNVKSSTNTTSADNSGYNGFLQFPQHHHQKNLHIQILIQVLVLLLRQLTLLES